jgi:hypothetical protein
MIRTFSLCLYCFSSASFMCQPAANILSRS